MPGLNIPENCVPVPGNPGRPYRRNLSRKMQHIGMSWGDTSKIGRLSTCIWLHYPSGANPAARLSSDPPPITCDGRDAAVLPKGHLTAN